MGCSCPSRFFCNRTAATVCSEAKEKIRNSFEKSRLIRTGARVSACFTNSKDFLVSTVHFTPTSFLSVLFMFLRSSAKLGINLLKKLIFPIKDCNYFMFLGWLIYSIPSTLFGSILIPFSDIIWPRSLPSYRPNIVFLGFKDSPNLLHFSKTFLRCLRCSSSVLE